MCYTAVAARVTLTRLYSVFLHLAKSGNSFQPFKDTHTGLAINFSGLLRLRGSTLMNNPSIQKLPLTSAL